MPEVLRLDFHPSRHGFHFVNAFINHVTPGITTYGLCGGLSLAAARYWLNRVPIPPQTAADFPDGTPPGVPPVGSVLHSYIYGCQLASYGPLGLLSAANWVTLPGVTWDHQFDWSVQEFAAVRRRINEGIPTVLGLRRREGGPMGHQVLVYGYDANDWQLFVYDPNYPDVEKCLRLNRMTRRIEYDGSGSPEWSSYFVTGCSVEGEPPPPSLKLAQAMWIHGHSMQIEVPDSIDRASKAGFYVEVEGKPDSTNWFHFAIPSKVIVQDRRLRVGSVMLQLETLSAEAIVRDVHIYDGDTRIAEHNGVNITGNAGLLRFDVPTHPPVNWGIGISVGVTFQSGSGSRVMRFKSAGCDFIAHL